MINAANTDFIQATIEIFGAVICLVVGAMLTIITGNKKKSERTLLGLVIVTMLSLLVDAGWYMFDGNTTVIGVVINRFCNLAIFLCNPGELTLAALYILFLIRENDKKPIWVFYNVLQAFLILIALMPISNLFIPWMYSFDQQNVYYRLTGWYIYTVCNALAIILINIFLYRHRSALSLRKQISLHIFLCAPIAGTILQTLNLGISFIQLSTSIGLILVLNTYVNEWIKSETTKRGVNYEQKKFWLIELVFVVIILCISAAIMSAIVSVNTISQRNSQQSSMAVAHLISETFDEAVAEPITVSRTMAQSDTVRKAMTLEQLEGTQTEQELVAYMRRIRDEYDYQTIFAAIEQSNAYYTFDGFSRIMEVNPGERDLWYTEYKNRGLRYELNVDDDKDYHMTQAVFVNMEVRDENQQYIGVCGVAMSMDSLIEMLDRFEKQYNLNICLTNEEGLIEVAVDRDRIEQDRIDPVYLKEAGSEQFTYYVDRYSAKLTKYMGNLGWYLYVEDMEPNKINLMLIILPSLIIYAIGIFLMVAFIWLFNRHEHSKNDEIMENKVLSSTDGLTGLGNRKAYENCIAELMNMEIPEELSIIMIDINELKTVNDTIGHKAGDELIVGVANCIAVSFGGDSQLFRTGGDEFLVITYLEENLLQEALSHFKQEMKDWRGELVQELTASVGVAGHGRTLGLSIKQLVDLADQRMYVDKNAYYRRTGKERRRHLL